MYEKIQNDIKQNYYSDNYSNDGQKFVAWYLRNIYNLDEIETKDSIVDGAGDKQIDAVYIDNQECKIYIIQGKYYKGTVDAEPIRELLSCWTQIKDLKQLQESANNKLKSKIQEIATALQDDYDLFIEFLTTANLTDAAINDFNVFKQEMSASDTLPAELVLVDKDVLETRYNDNLNRNRPYIDYNFILENNKFLQLDLNGTKAVIAAVPLRECFKIPGIKDGTLFRKNVRQSLGSGNKVNKGIATTIKNNPEDFFFLHNGITAICSSLKFDNNILYTKGLNIVNGCQSLSTIYSSSEAVRNNTNGYILFRFYEIADDLKCDSISTSTNTQSAVKARDLRSNDKSVLAIKKSFEQLYSDGYFITKRGEQPNTAKYNTAHICNLTDLGKQLISWHSQRPTIAYSETKIFDKYFTQLFKKDYDPENVQALHELYEAVLYNWLPENNNPLNFNESLLAMKAYAPYHHLYAISVFIDALNNMQSENVPNPKIVLRKLKESNLLNKIVNMAGNALNTGFESANEQTVQEGKVFSPQNWIKSKGSLTKIRDAVKPMLSALEMLNKNVVTDMRNSLKLQSNDFSARWTAD
ncbi:MAG: AIPR family protein [Spirochaetia bacterium]|nr:AIPR family protein [Spirochaetia bacterium]